MKKLKEEPVDELTEELIAEYVSARERVAVAEDVLKAKKRELTYYEEVIWLLGIKTIRAEQGTVSVGSTSYASIAKRDFPEATQFLFREFKLDLQDFLSSDMTLTTQKKLAKLLPDSSDLPEFIKVFEKPTLRLRISQLLPDKSGSLPVPSSGFEPESSGRALGTTDGKGKA